MPIVKLTPLNVKTLPPVDGKRTDYRDQAQAGLLLRVTPNGARTWAVVYKVRGKERKFKIGKFEAGREGSMDLAGAREEARRVRSRVNLGADPQQERNDSRRTVAGITVGQLIERFTRAIGKPGGPALRDSTRVEWLRLLDVEVPASMKATPAAELTRSTLRAWARTIAARSMAVGIHVHQALGRVFSWALQEELLQATPFVGLKPPGRNATSDRVLSAEELRFLLLALGDLGRVHSTAVELLLLTMTRKSSVLGMHRGEFVDLDGDAPLWIVPAERAKRKLSGRAADRPHVVPLSTWAARRVSERLEAIGGRGERLFPPTPRGPRVGRRTKAPWASLPTQFRVRLRKAVNIRHAAAKLDLDVDAEEPLLAAAARLQAEAALKSGRVAPVPRWTIHNLRHTAATQLREQLGVSQDVVSLLLGHTAPGAPVTGIYDRAQLLPARRAALVAWADWLDRLRNGAAGARVLPHHRRSR